MTRNAMIGAAVVLWTMAAATCAWAADTTNEVKETTTKSSHFTPKEGFFVGLQFVNNFMSGDFDDTSYLTGGGTVYDIPDVDDGMGFGVSCGARFDRGAFELSYQRTTHDTSSSFVDVGESEATYSLVEFNFKFDLIRTRLRPYLQIGFGFPWMTIDDSAADYAGYQDETFFGMDANVGAGLTYFITDRWALNAGVVYRWNWFFTVDGKSIENTLLENTLNCTVGFSYTF